MEEREELNEVVEATEYRYICNICGKAASQLILPGSTDPRAICPGCALKLLKILEGEYSQ